MDVTIGYAKMCLLTKKKFDVLCGHLDNLNLENKIANAFFNDSYRKEGTGASVLNCSMSRYCKNTWLIYKWIHLEVKLEYFLI